MGLGDEKIGRMKNFRRLNGKGSKGSEGRE